MANLVGSDIGLNYKGLINIGSTINQNVSASLQSLTDGDGNNLPLQVSTTQFIIGGGLSTGRLVVKGDGTNSIFDFQNGAGSSVMTLANTGNLVVSGNIASSGGSLSAAFGAVTIGFSNPRTAITYPASSSYGGLSLVHSGSIARTSGNAESLISSATFASSAGSAIYRHASFNYTINNSGAQTGTATGIYLNATETALNGMTHTLMDLQVGGVSAFKVDKFGSTALNSITSNSWLIQFTDSATGFLLYRGANRFKVTAAGVMVLPGNAYIGADNTSPSARLHVRGDGTNPIFRYENSAGTGLFTLDAAGTTLVYNPAAVSANLELRATHYFSLKIITNYNSFNFTTNAVSNSGLSLANSAGSVFYLNFAGTETSGHYAARAVMNFSQSSGIVPFNAFSYTGTINQTGGANGITRGVYVAPTLTAAADFRALDVLTGSTSAHKLIQLANAAGNKVFEVNAAQEIGLFGVTPILQPTTGIAGATTVVGIGLPITEDTTFGGYTVAQISQALINLGILKP